MEVTDNLVTSWHAIWETDKQREKLNFKNNLFFFRGCSKKTTGTVHRQKSYSINLGQKLK